MSRFLIATMVMGMIIANFAKHHSYPFHEIEGMEWPVLSIFFVLAGASLDFLSLKTIGLLGFAYMGLRCLGKIIGGYFGGKIGKCSPLINRWLGLAMLPHAGAALGMALVAANLFPQCSDALISLVICATIIFEVAGRLFTKKALEQTEHTGQK